MRFLADGMLGRLVRWLRILGYDTAFPADTDDKNLIDIAVAENRILLTMDTELYKKSISQGITAHLVEPNGHLNRLASLASRFNLRLDLDEETSRCPICNSVLQRIRRGEAEGRVPSSSFSLAKIFWECTGCGKLYWQGSHWRNIRARLEDVKKLLV